MCQLLAQVQGFELGREKGARQHGLWGICALMALNENPIFLWAAWYGGQRVWNLI